MPTLQKLIKILLVVLVFFAICAGIYFRFYQIRENKFFYYDEGYYLGFDRTNAEVVERHLPLSASDLWRSLQASAIVSLGSTKALWMFLIDLRVYVAGVKAWYFPRVLSAIFGVMTILATYVFAQRYFRSRMIAVLSAVFIALLPSHIFYSRMALQESLSTLLFLLGFYVYWRGDRKFFTPFLSGVLFAGVYYTNYRLIIMPVLLLCSELFVCYSSREKIDLRRFIWTVTFFLVFVFGCGNLGGAQNTYTTFSWMFHQADLAKENFSFLNYLSYPYYLLRLESLLFLIFFVSSFFCDIKKGLKEQFPFFICLLVMMMFSLAMEKGARYLCIIFPFMSMAVAYCVVTVYRKYQNISIRFVLIGLVVAMMFVHVKRSWAEINFNSDYERSMTDILYHDPDAKVISTQSTVQGLFAPIDHVAPGLDKYYLLRAQYRNGYHYLVIEPQAYISLTRDAKRFSKDLEGYLSFIDQSVPPVKEYTHFEPAMLERFVFEHSEDLLRSIEFLRSNKGGKLGRLKVFDVKQCLDMIDGGIQMQKALRR